MKQYKKKIAIICLILSLCMMLTACGSTPKQQVLKDKVVTDNETVVPNEVEVTALPEQLGITETTSSKLITTYTEVARNSNSILYADLEKGHFALQNINTEKIWYSTPNNSELDEFTTAIARMEIRSQVLMHYIFKSEQRTTPSYKTENSHTGCVTTGGIETEVIENGFRVNYTFRKTKVVIPVEYTLTNDSFKAKIIVDEIVEPDDVYLMGVTLLPVFGAGYNNEEGYIFVPDGSGALVNFGSHNPMETAYKFTLYGEELAVKQEADPLETENFRLPVFGTKTGNDAMVGIITEGDVSSAISAVYGTPNCGYTAAASTMWYRSNDCKLMFSKGSGGISDTLYRVSECHSTRPAYTVEYSLLDGEDAEYVGMAKKYRSYLEEKGDISEIKETPMINLEVYGAAELTTSFLGVKYSKIENLTTISQAEKIVDILKEKGIEDIALRYAGFSGNGLLNKKIVTSTKPRSSLGSTKEMAALGQKVKLYPDFDFVQIRKGGNGVTLANDIIRNVFDYKGEQFTFSKSVYSREISEDTIYILNGNAVLASARKVIGDYGKSGYKNVSLSSVGDKLYSDFSAETGVYRDTTSRYFSTLLHEFANKTDSLAVESANAYILKYADRIWKAPTYSSGYDIYSKDVPFYQIVLHGSKALTTPTVIQSEDPRVTILKAVETGSELMFGCTYEDSTVLIDSRFEGNYSTQYESWMDYAVDAYKSYKPLLEKIYNKQIVSHTEIADGVFVTAFENGVSVAVNYNTTQAVLPTGQTVSAKGYCELNGGITNEEV